MNYSPYAGIGSQALALKYLGVKFEHHRIAEWAVKSIQAYKDLHFPDDNNDYSEDWSFFEIVEYLFNKGISSNYNEPMTKEQIIRMGESKARTVFNNIHATNNLVSVCNVKGEDLGIKDTDEFTYLLILSLAKTFQTQVNGLEWKKIAVQEVGCCGKSNAF